MFGMPQFKNKSKTSRTYVLRLIFFLLALSLPKAFYFIFIFFFETKQKNFNYVFFSHSKLEVWWFLQACCSACSLVSVALCRFFVKKNQALKMLNFRCLSNFKFMFETTFYSIFLKTTTSKERRTTKTSDSIYNCARIL